MTTLAQETLQAVCPTGTPAPKQPWLTKELCALSLARRAYWRSIDEQKEATKKAVFRAWRGQAGRQLCRRESRRWGHVRDRHTEWSGMSRRSGSKGGGLALSGSLRGSLVAPRRRPVAVIADEDGTQLLDEEEIGARWGTVFFQEFSGRGSASSSKTLKGRQRELRAPWQDQPRPDGWPDEEQLAADACDVRGNMQNKKAMGGGQLPCGVLTGGWTRKPSSLPEVGSLTSGWCAEQMARRRFVGVPLGQDLLDDRQDQDSAGSTERRSSCSPSSSRR